jgi:hypothetical protein
MKKAIRYVITCVLFLIATFGTVSSSSRVDKATVQDDPACRNACFTEYQTCFFAAYPSKPEMQKCLAAYHHCIAHCK